MHAPIAAAPSRRVTGFAHLLPEGGHVLDLACGSGRHLRWLVQQGFKVTGVDRDTDAVAPLRTMAAPAEIIVADLEGAPWPLGDRRFDGIVVTNYLWRALLPRIAAALAPGGVLIYETFADGQEHFGRPSRPEFLLARGELLRAFADLQVVAFEEGLESDPERCVQRIVAVAAGSAGSNVAAAKITALRPLRPHWQPPLKT